ncbi:replication-relaxation family protein [Streptomyces erythrochromogenes]|uniref:replication-relaxation family protein n=1 Tax=Streptomyces erythrochromogenes TaxID=285574 RepID=UPI0033E4332B
MNDSNVVPITAVHTARQGAARHADASLPNPETAAKGQESTPTAGKVRVDALKLLGCVRIATVRQMGQVITAEESDGRSYVRRAMVELTELGLVETNGKDGKHRIWNLTRAGQKALADGNELPPRPKAGTGAKAVRAGFGPHGLAVTDTILAYTDTVLRASHNRTAVSVRSKSFTTSGTDRAPRRHISTISALKSAVNCRLGRGFFFGMFSIMDTPYRARAQIFDVRQPKQIHISTCTSAGRAHHVVAIPDGCRSGLVSCRNNGSRAARAFRVFRPRAAASARSCR